LDAFSPDHKGYSSRFISILDDNELHVSGTEEENNVTTEKWGKHFCPKDSCDPIIKPNKDHTAAVNFATKVP